MTPLGHLAVAVLTASSERYARRATGLCLVGAALPDVVDKPLVALGAVEVAHAVGHSVVTLGLAALAATRIRTLAPVVAGWAGHVAADLVVAYPQFLRNYAWPLLAPRPTPNDPWLAYWLEYAVGPLFGLELLLAAAAVVAVERRRSRPRKASESTSE